MISANSPFLLAISLSEIANAIFEHLIHKTNVNDTSKN